jgi:hypothetical protein
MSIILIPVNDTRDIPIRRRFCAGPKRHLDEIVDETSTREQERSTHLECSIHIERSTHIGRAMARSSSSAEGAARGWDPRLPARPGSTEPATGYVPVPPAAAPPAAVPAAAAADDNQAAASAISDGTHTDTSGGIELGEILMESSPRSDRVLRDRSLSS